MNFKFIAGLAAVCALPLHAASLQPKDFAALREVAVPRLSPDGSRVVYTVRQADLVKDKRNTHLWLARWDGGDNRQLTFGDGSEANPKWSPDGRALAFITSRSEDRDAPDQLWLLDLGGGEAHALTTLKSAVEDFDWSPDGKHIVMVVQDVDPAAVAKAKAVKDGDSDKTMPPIVIRRYQFKQDIDGYLSERRSHLGLLELASGKVDMLTIGDHDERLPAFSPDGRSIAYVSKRGVDADHHNNWDVYLIAPVVGAHERQLTTSLEADGYPDWQSPPAWSPDSSQIAYLHGGDAKLIEYAANSLAVIPAAGGEARVLTAALDRNLSKPQWIKGGHALAAIVENDKYRYLVRVDARSGQVEPMTEIEGAISDFDVATNGHLVLLKGSSSQPYEVVASEGRNLRPLSRQNDTFLKALTLGKVEDFQSKSSDGNDVHGFLTLPVNVVAGQKLPTVLFLHGGPQAQFDASFQYFAQLFAANGYAVLTVNPRGSTGRGTAYASAIYADWGNKDVQDVIGAVDELVKRGIADPDRLVVGGWSYGGMLTNYTIASDTRFKAAVSGASIANILAGYGSDEYIRDYDAELGQPWRNLDVWLRISYPFLHADRIKTPTLFMGGAEDYNVPLIHQQQMYQALQGVGVPTELVIYPGQFHGFTKPSYILDRYQRWLAWYGQWLGPTK